MAADVLKQRQMSASRLACLLAACVILGGCVSQSSAPQRSTPVSMSQAMEDHVQLGLSYIGQGNREAARHHLNKALEIDSRSAGAHNGLALLYQMEQENDLAEKSYKRAIALDRNFSRARNNYGVFLVQQNRMEEARDQFARVVEDTNYEQRPLAFLNLGLTARQLGREDEAVEAWSRAIALNPRLSAPYLELADYHFSKGEFPLAQRMLSAHDSLSRPTARSLWLGLRIENEFGNRDAVASKGLALEKLFPYSSENLEYKKWLGSGRR